MLRSLRTRVGRPVVVLVVAVLVLPASASAGGGSPLHVDPASPVAKAYALPLGTARSGSSGGGHGPQLFGSGIKRTPSSTPKRLRGVATPAAYRVLRPGSAPGLEWMAISAIVVIALGGAGALAFRRRR